MHALCADSSEALFALQQFTVRCETICEIAVLFAPAQRAVTRGLQTGSMKKLAFPTTEQTVDDVMRRWPSTIRVFLDFRMHCVGCPIATFHSVEEACSEHGIDLRDLPAQPAQGGSGDAAVPAGLD